MSNGEFFSHAQLIIAAHWKRRRSDWFMQLFPAAMIWLVWIAAHHYHTNYTPLRSDRFELRDESLNISALRPLELEGEHAVYYAPNNDFTDRLMRSFRDECFPWKDNGDASRHSNLSVSVKGFASETELLKAYREIELLGLRDPRQPTMSYAGVIFAADFGEASKTLHYKIQSGKLTYDRLFYEQTDWDSSSGDDYLTRTNRILSTQTCLDASFIKLKTSNGSASPNYNITLKRLNLPNERDFSRTDNAYFSYVSELETTNAFILSTLVLTLVYEIASLIYEDKGGIDNFIDSTGVSRIMYYLISHIFSIVYLTFVIIFGAALTGSTFVYAGSFFIQSDTSLLIVLFTMFVNHNMILIFNLFFITRNNGIMLLQLVPLQKYVCFSTFVALGMFLPSTWYLELLRTAEYMEMNAEGLRWRDVLNFSDTPQITVSFAMLIVTYFIFVALLWLKPQSKQKLKVKISSKPRVINPNIQTPSLKSNPVIELKNVNVFKDDANLKNISMEFYEKEIASVIECNGHSNHTLLRALSEPLLAEMSIKIPKYKTGIFTGVDGFLSRITIRDNLRFMAQFRCKRRSDYDIEQEINDIAETFKLTHELDSYFYYLSKGQLRRLSLAMTMVGDTDLVLLNNPTKGLDKADVCIIWVALNKLKNYKKAIIVSTDSMLEAEFISDRIAVLISGQLECYGTPKYLKELYAPGACLGHAARKWKDSDDTHAEADYLRNLNKTAIVAGEPTLEDLFSDVHEPIQVQQLESPLARYNKLSRKKRCESTGNVRRYILNKHLFRRLSFFWKSTIFGLLLLGAAKYNSMLNTPVIDVPETIGISPNMYRNAETYVSAFNESLENNYGSSGHWNTVKLTGGNLTNALYQRAKDQLATFGTRLVAAAEFGRSANGTIVGSAIFTSKAVYSLPISLNLANNALLKYMTDFEHDIRVHLQRIPSINSLFNSTEYDRWVALAWALAYLIWLTLLVRNFLHLPLEENVKEMKHLQFMAGMSRTVYWGYLILYDLMLAVPCIAITLGTIFYLHIYEGAHFHNWQSMELISIMCLHFLFSGLEICYILSCIKINMSSAVRMMIGIFIFTTTLNLIWIAAVDGHTIVSLNTIAYFSPFHTFFTSIVSIYQTAIINNKCKLTPNEYQVSNCTEYRDDTCCRMQCYDGTCKYPLQYKDFYENNVPLLIPYFKCIILPHLIFFTLILAESPRKFCYKYFSRLYSITILRNYKTPSESMIKEKQVISQIVTELKGEDYTFAKQYLQNDKQLPKKSGNAPRSDEEVIVVHELYKSSFTKQLIYDVSLRVGKGECLGIVSPYKAGKSTLLKMIVGAQTPEDGSIFIKGKKAKDMLKKMAYCPQEIFLYDELTVAEHFHIFSRLRKIPEKLEAAEIEYWSKLFQINKYLQSKGSALTTNVRKRTMMALTVMGGPEVLVLDQPTAGCNAYSKRIIWTVIKSLKAAKCTILLATDNFDEADVLCDRVSTMIKGQLMNNLVPRDH
ncbi:hypothetical protein TKK_0002419 [Trichogramma kaykai]|uniref:ABC transporter domain-containing protein n=1 Tax=Trichogramma kaykai TaxID=54128 RepID=A0ABD2VXL7_9HYME